MNVSLINFNSYKTPFLGNLRRLKSSDFSVKLTEREDYEKPVFYGLYGARDLKRSDYKKIEKVIEEAKDYKTDRFGYPKMKSDYYNKLYDFPIAFAIDVIKREKRGQDAHIIDEVPQMFQGIDKKELLSTLDMVCVFLKNNDDKIIFEMGKKEFSAKRLGSGAYGAVYKLTCENYPPLAFKVYSSPKNISNHGPFGEIAIEREMSKAGVIDVPKFYMASPLGTEVIKEGETKPISYASWKISEFVDKKTPLKQGSLTWKKFLDKKALTHEDFGYSNKVGEYCVDFGGVKSEGHNEFYGRYSYMNKTLVMDMINKSIK